MSLVPFLSLFFILTIFNLFGSYLLTLSNSLNIFKIYFYFDEHLHRSKSPKRKVNKFGG